MADRQKGGYERTQRYAISLTSYRSPSDQHIQPTIYTKVAVTQGIDYIDFRVRSSQTRNRRAKVNSDSSIRAYSVRKREMG